MSDLFNKAAVSQNDYSAKDIEVLEGLEPVRRRPGMYIGGTDEVAFHHLAAEILDNAMDEVVAGFAKTISISLEADGRLTIRDDGRGIPVDKHPKYPDKSALEVIMTTLHSGGKFGSSAYKVSGGLHGVGLSVVNALSSELTVDVVKNKHLYRQTYSRGFPTSALEDLGTTNLPNGSAITFIPDTEIFGDSLHFKPIVLYRMARAKAFLFRGVELKWHCDASLIKEGDTLLPDDTLHFPNGLEDFLAYRIGERPTVTPKAFAGKSTLSDDMGYVEWAITWPDDYDDGFTYSYCNTIHTSQGGAHETGMRAALTKSLRSYAEMIGNKKASDINADDITGTAAIMLSLFMKNPQFQGQTKDRLVSSEAARLVENAMKDMFDHWLSGDTKSANLLLSYILDRAEERKRKKKINEMARASATKRLRLPGKLADCSHKDVEGTELFLVEGDSAGGSAKQARNREKQAILPLRGKILNVASASEDKIFANEEIKDITEALGCGRRDKFDESALRYEKIIIMTDADVDGAHIATLLMTLFYREMPKLIAKGHLYLAMPPLYRLTLGDKSVYAADDEAKERILKTVFKNNPKVEISRFKGLGEMPPHQLKETTMSPESRTLLRVLLPDPSDETGTEYTANIVEQLMGTKPELRFRYIQEHAKFIDDLDI
ncbi:MAG: DNA topoisomerase IV subunit B [Alphaproteobacteria bacterium]|nr:DNA topoisomerase IV subunit B [Alphaproteobacteria bacterium]